MGGGVSDRRGLAGGRLRRGAGSRRLRGYGRRAQRVGARGASRGGPGCGGNGQGEKRETWPESSQRGCGQRTTSHTPAIITTSPSARLASTGRTAAPKRPKWSIKAAIRNWDPV